jgi:putative tricarboxylic transport membrane protein
MTTGSQGNSRTPGEAGDSLAAGILFVLFALATVWLSLRMPIGTFRSAGPGLFPLCLGLLLAVLATVHTVRTALAIRRASPRSARPQREGSLKPVLGFLAAIAFAAALLEHAGYAPTACVVVFALLQLLAPRSRLRNATLALASAAVAHLVFVQWLQIPFPQGWLGV